MIFLNSEREYITSRFDEIYSLFFTIFKITQDKKE
nr:MAG TPA: hypothetical protein [Caudoviricetes sp.]DAX13433.1 MAG TPA: hypothetical protein [Bacteriophage sp.]DAX82165.1 MAG TPA: hypothetical protein [Caudoviricetes sp.]